MAQVKQTRPSCQYFQNTDGARRFKNVSLYGKQSFIKESDGIEWVILTRKKMERLILPGNEVSAETGCAEDPSGPGNN